MLRWIGQLRSGASADGIRESTNDEQLTVWQRQANAHLDAKEYPEARALYERILEAVPHDLYVIYQLAAALQGIGDLDAAARVCDRGLVLAPDQPGLMSRRGAIARARQQFVLALKHYERLKALHPEFPFVDAMIADQLALLGRGAEAMAAFDRALEATPGNVRIQSDRLFILNYFGLMSRSELFEEHRRWGDSHEAALRDSWFPHPQSREPDRRLRIGYVSSDLRRHAVAYFIEGILRHHDHRLFDIHAIDVSPHPEDSVTHRLKAFVPHWHRLGDRSDDDVAKVVRDLEIDILVDLSGHTAHNRLLVFARRPAPIQVSWFGYMNTTGLASIDYRFTDASLDPPGASEAFYTEKLLRLPSAACFQPDAESPDVVPLPALRNGYLTFASLNQWTKVSSLARDAWACILRNVPAARLVVVARGGDDAGVRTHIVEEFKSRGVEHDRISVVGFRPLKSFLSLLNTIDLALDPFPYGGGTTTLHSAWMGIPVVALESEGELGRSTPGILRTLGLSALVADDVERYVQIATGLANDTERLARYRAELRDRFSNSPLTDALPLTRAVEYAYRSMWRTHCGSGPAGQ